MKAWFTRRERKRTDVWCSLVMEDHHVCVLITVVKLIDHVVADDAGEGRVRVGALEPGVGDEAVGRLGEVDAVPADVRVGIVAHRGTGQPARRAHVVVVRASAAAARP